MIQKFDSFKLKKAGDVKIITLKIDGKAVVIDQEYPRSTTWESFHADQLGGALETEPRYVLLDHVRGPRPFWWSGFDPRRGRYFVIFRTRRNGLVPSSAGYPAPLAKLIG